MAKITLDNVAGGYDLSVINNNFDKIEAELQNKVLYRDNPVGESNTFEVDIDVNGHYLYNAPQAITDSGLTTLAQVRDIALTANDRIPEIGNYAQLQNYTGDFTSFYIRGVTNIFDGGAGVFRVDPADSTSDDNGGITLVDALGRRWKREFNGFLQVEWFGVDTSGSVDSTAGVQKALDTAKATRHLAVQLPQGKLSLTNLVIPSGLAIFGHYHGSFGLGNEFGADYYGTVLQQASGAAGPFITIETLKSSPSADLIGPLHLQGFSVVGNGEVGSGDGIRFQSADMAAEGVENAACTRTTRIQAITMLRDLLVRNFAGNGIWMPNCHVGATIQNCYSGFNGGYGLFFDVSTGLLDGMAVRDFQGDANLLGLIGIYKMGSTFDPSDVKDHTVTLENITAEMRTNPQAFAGGAVGQNNAIVFDTCDSGNVLIRNLKHYSVVTSDKPGDTIVIKNQAAGYAPNIRSESVINTIKPSYGQDVSGDTLGYLLNDTANGVTFPSGTAFFTYGRNTVESKQSPSSATKPWGMVGAGTPVAISVSSGGYQAHGATPVYALWETDAGADLKGWSWVASGGTLTLRSLTDAGVGDIALNLTRSAGVVTGFEFKKSVTLEQAVLKATALPTFADDASAGTGGLTAGRIYKTATGELRIKL